MSVRDTWTWFSPILEREMSVARFGHWGKPVLLFPTAGGDYLEHERFLMVKALGPLIDGGAIKLYLCGNVNRAGWINTDASPRTKTALQAAFDAYLAQELFPFILADCEHTEVRIATAGTSLGAYNAVNSAAKHPEWVDRAITMSGTFDLEWRLDGHWDLDFYYNSPLHFLPNLGDGEQLQALRRSGFALGVGRGRAESPEYSARMVETLRSKGIPAVLEVWDEDAHHDWPTWRAKLPGLLERYAL